MKKQPIILSDLSLKGNEGKAFIAGDYSKLRQDNVYVPNSIVPLKELTNGIQGKKGYEFAIISNNKLVNVVSDGYGHLPNEKFFLAVEEKLINADINYLQRSVNRNDTNFAVDYILNDSKIITEVNSKKLNSSSGGTIDKIRPMLRFVNSYDGSTRKMGYFGFFREVCANGLHMAQTEIGFSLKAKGNIEELILPEIHSILNKFMNNEYYSLVRKFEVLAERAVPADMIPEFVRMVCDKTKIFNYACSKENPEPSLNARIVIDTINRESSLLGINANYWLGYNAFNEVVHDKLKQSFEKQKTNDRMLFEYLSN